MSTVRLSKIASAFVRDVALGDLPQDTLADVLRFSPGAKKTDRVPFYGCVVKELTPKCDQNNLRTARANVRGESDKKVEKEFYDKLKKKYVLMVNDSVIDGHHFIAKGEKCGCTCSLNVLDLTPLRFQKKGSRLSKIAGALNLDTWSRDLVGSGYNPADDSFIPEFTTQSAEMVGVGMDPVAAATPVLDSIAGLFKKKKPRFRTTVMPKTGALQKLADALDDFYAAKPEVQASYLRQTFQHFKNNPQLAKKLDVPILMKPLLRPLLDQALKKNDAEMQGLAGYVKNYDGLIRKNLSLLPQLRN